MCIQNWKFFCVSGGKGEARFSLPGQRDDGRIPADGGDLDDPGGVRQAREEVLARPRGVASLAGRRLGPGRPGTAGQHPLPVGRPAVSINPRTLLPKLKVPRSQSYLLRMTF